jgi:hypothetical protein
MEKLTYEAYLRNPDLRERLLQDARRERSKAVHGVISRAARALFSRPRRPATALALHPSTCG